MFVIEETDQIGPLGDHTCVIDHSKDAWIQRVYQRGMSDEMVFKLVWKGRVIPFGVSGIEDVSDRALKNRTFLRQIRNAGRASSAAQYGIENYDFSNPAEKEEAIELMAEAVITFGQWYGSHRGIVPFSVQYSEYDLPNRQWVQGKHWLEKID